MDGEVSGCAEELLCNRLEQRRHKARRDSQWRQHLDVHGLGGLWNETSVGAPQFWSALASSSDGTKLAAAVYAGNVWTSTDSGGTWTEGPVNTKDKYWQAIASSSDGTKLAAAVWNGAIWTSADSGATWTERTVGLPTGSAVGAYPAPFWNAIASSSDGTAEDHRAIGP